MYSPGSMALGPCARTALVTARSTVSSAPSNATAGALAIATPEPSFPVAVSERCAREYWPQTARPTELATARVVPLVRARPAGRRALSAQAARAARTHSAFGSKPWASVSGSPAVTGTSTGPSRGSASSLTGLIRASSRARSRARRQSADSAETATERASRKPPPSRKRARMATARRERSPHCVGPTSAKRTKPSTWESTVTSVSSAELTSAT